MNLTTGKEGEKIAEKHLREKGYKILTKNFRTNLGEIDIICLDRETIIFVEVKTNTSKDFGAPESRVDSRKQRQIIKGALSFLKQRGKLNSDCRFDVVSILLMKNAKPEIEHIENAFQADGYLL